MCVYMRVCMPMSVSVCDLILTIVSTFLLSQEELAIDKVCIHTHVYVCVSVYVCVLYSCGVCSYMGYWSVELVL